jgi:hypothetical protein
VSNKSRTVAENTGFVSGHDFSLPEKQENDKGFTGCGKTQPRGFVTRARLYRLRKNSTKGLCNKGTALQAAEKLNQGAL